MIPLSELLKQDRPLARSSVPDEPVQVRRAHDDICRRWPNVDEVDPETDAEALALEMEHRRRNDDWRHFSWSDARRTAVALLDSGLWEDKRFKPLFYFTLHRIPGANGAYVRSMFRKYLETFDLASDATHNLAAVLKRHWSAAALPIGSLAHHLRIFDLPDRHAPVGRPPHLDPTRIIAEYMDKQHDPFGALRAAGMEAPHGPGLMQAAHLRFVEKVAPRIRDGDLDAIRRLLDWISPDSRRPLQGNGAGKAIDALLRPWSTEHPSPRVQELLETRLVRAYGDPRVTEWPACDGASRDVVLKWLAGATIQVFFDIVTQADGSHMWSDREGLWRDLYEEGRITQACFALSQKGVDIARRLDNRREDVALVEFAENRSSTAQDRQKCLLMMSIDGRWVVEGSHSFPTWVFPRQDITTFTPYEDSYTCDQFRDAQGPERPERIVHSSAWKDAVMTALQ